MSRLVFNRNGGSADEYGHLLALNRLLTGDVIQGMTVTQDTGTNMAIRVQAGTARIGYGSAPGNYGFFVGIDTANPGEQVTITTANASNPRNDLIVAYVDLGVTPSTASPNNPNNMLKLLAVAGTPAATPADPSASAIQSAVGASNPYIVLARVVVGTAVTQVTTANCVDLRTLVSVAVTGGVLADFVPTTVGWASPTVVFRWRQTGKLVTCMFAITGTSNSTSTSLTLPVPARAGQDYNLPTGFAVDSGTAINNNGTGRMVIDPSSNASLLTIYSNMFLGSWTASGTKQVRGVITYEAA